MSTEAENTASASPCDQALDYAYGELAPEQAAALEQHLAGCAKCQAEVAMVKRVRSVVAAALPPVDPPAVTTGALHQQLLHAAAQRRPAKGGKILQFARRMVAHPGYEIGRAHV